VPGGSAPDDGTSESDRMSSAAAGRAGLATQLRELEAFAAQSESAGDALPPEAIEMIARLREIVQALDGLTASLDDRALPSAGATRPPDGT
jgi:hypothetical protein